VDDNEIIYGRKVPNRSIFTKLRRVPECAVRLIGLLHKYSAREDKVPTGQ